MKKLILLAALCTLSLLQAQPVVDYEAFLDKFDETKLIGRIYPEPQKRYGEAVDIALSGVIIIFPGSDAELAPIIFPGSDAELAPIHALGAEHLESLAAKLPAAEGAPIAVIVAGELANAEIAAYIAKHNITVPELPKNGYIIRIIKNSDTELELLCAGADERGTMFALVSLAQSLVLENGAKHLRLTDVDDYPYWPERYASDDVDPGNYELYKRLAKNKISSFAWQCRFNWRTLEPMGRHQRIFNDIKRAQDEGLLDFMLLCHIYAGAKLNGSNFDPANQDDIDSLCEKLRQVASYNIKRIMLCVDDYTPRVGDEYVFFPEDNAAAFDNKVGKAHGYIARRVYEAIAPDYPDVQISLVGAPYALKHGIGIPTIDQYVIDWAAEAPKEVAWVWTGPVVCSDKISREDFDIMNALLDGHPSFIWDNSNCFYGEIPVWDTEFYEGMREDSGGILYMNNRVFFHRRLWMWLYTVTANDYLWNPHAYDAERSAATAITTHYGADLVEPVLNFREAYMAMFDAIATGDRLNVDKLYADISAAYAALPITNPDIERIMKHSRDFFEIRPKEQSIRQAKQAPVIDGKLDDEAWKNASELEMVSRDDSKIDDPARCWMTYTPDGIYLAFEIANTTELADIGKLPVDRSVFLHDDCVEMFIKPALNRSYAHLCFDYEGNRFDEAGSDGGFGWHPYWEVVTARSDKGWTAEVFVPVIELELIGSTPCEPGRAWYGNILRVNNKGKKIEVWTPGGANFHTPEYFGTFKFE